jgi:hypothetical protein
MKGMTNPVPKGKSVRVQAPAWRVGNEFTLDVVTSQARLCSVGQS